MIMMMVMTHDYDDDYLDDNNDGNNNNNNDNMMKITMFMLHPGSTLVDYIKRKHQVCSGMFKYKYIKKVFKRLLKLQCCWLPSPTASTHVLLSMRYSLAPYGSVTKYNNTNPTWGEGV